MNENLYQSPNGLEYSTEIPEVTTPFADSDMDSEAAVKSLLYGVEDSPRPNDEGY